MMVLVFEHLSIAIIIDSCIEIISVSYAFSLGINV